MNDLNYNDDSRFDRLVDGELSEKERRDLLANLDNEPGGWRRCALAFLESQCWKDSFHGMNKGNSSQSSPRVSPVLRTRSHWLVHLRTAMTLAACIMAALLIGSFLPRGRTPTSPSGNQVATLDTGRPATSSAVQRGGGAMPARHEESPDGWRMVTLTPSNGEGEASALRLPAVERQSIDDAWLQNVPSAIPDEVLQALSRTGHQVQQRRELIPVPMKDGRRLLVPVDQVDVNYVGNGAY